MGFQKKRNIENFSKNYNIFFSKGLATRTIFKEFSQKEKIFQFVCMKKKILIEKWIGYFQKLWMNSIFFNFDFGRFKK